MSLEAALADITTRLRQDKYPNEQAISQGVVLRVLHELGWDTFDTKVVWPEYQTGHGRADFALCHPPSRPALFIEVKQPGMAEDAVRQALEYAFHAGAPFVVLTDGRTWSFYLPAEQGSYEDRRIHKLDLYERAAPDAAMTLRRYIERSRVESGMALEAAREEYRNRNRRSQARDEIPKAWQDLITKGDEQLVEMLMGAVESRVGVRPDMDDVAEFLASLDRSGVVEKSPPVMPPRSTHGPVSESVRGGKLILRGKAYQYQNAKQAMVIVLTQLAKSDPNFLERCSQHPDAEGRKRRYIARTKQELYPDREDLREMCATLPGGWLVSTNLNNILKKNIIRLAAEVAGLSFGKDVVVDF